MGEGDINPDHWNQSRATMLLVVIDGFTILQDLSNSLDTGHKFDKLASEILHIGNLEEEIGLCLLWETTPVSEVSHRF